MDLAAAETLRKGLPQTTLGRAAASEMSGAELQGEIHLRQIAEVERVMA